MQIIEIFNKARTALNDAGINEFELSLDSHGLHISLADNQLPLKVDITELQNTLHAAINKSEQVYFARCPKCGERRLTFYGADSKLFYLCSAAYCPADNTWEESLTCDLICENKSHRAAASV